PALYPLSLHASLPIFERVAPQHVVHGFGGGTQVLRVAREVVRQPQDERVVQDGGVRPPRVTLSARLERHAIALLVDQCLERVGGDRKSTRLNSSHVAI